MNPNLISIVRSIDVVLEPAGNVGNKKDDDDDDNQIRKREVSDTYFLGDHYCCRIERKIFGLSIILIVLN